MEAVREDAAAAARREAQTASDHAQTGSGLGSGRNAGFTEADGTVVAYGQLGWTPLGDQAQSTTNRFILSSRRA